MNNARLMKISWKGVRKNKTFCTLWHDLTSGLSGFANAIHVGLTSDFSVSTYVIVREVPAHSYVPSVINKNNKKLCLIIIVSTGETRLNTSCKPPIALLCTRLMLLVVAENSQFRCGLHFK